VNIKKIYETSNVDIEFLDNFYKELVKLDNLSFRANLVMKLKQVKISAIMYYKNRKLLNSILNEKIKEIKDLDTYKLFVDTKGWTANSKTDYVVEGFPRSSNSYFVRSLTHQLSKKNIDNVSIAHHTHDIYNLELGMALNIPCIALIREPKEAILSTYIYYDKKKPIKQLINDYRKFYIFVSENNTKLLVIDFKAVTNDISQVFDEINKRFYTDIPRTIDTEDIKDIEEKMQKSSMSKRTNEKHIKQSGLPSKERELIKDRLRNEVSQEVELAGLSNLYASIMKIL